MYTRRRTHRTFKRIHVSFKAQYTIIKIVHIDPVSVCLDVVIVVVFLLLFSSSSSFFGGGRHVFCFVFVVAKFKVYIGRRG